MIKQNALLNENLYIGQLSSGINCYIIPKSGYAEKSAMLAVRCGSADNRYTLRGKAYDMPAGIAHFLEHKLFEDPEMPVFDRFTQLGGSANAFTTFTHTAYYFSCIEHFDDNFRLLLNFCQKPYFTAENVEKEKGIISQEISMYDDNPSWRVYMNLQASLFGDSPLADNIAGTEKSIARITADMLSQVYNAFYFPANMAIICAGDLAPDYIRDMTENAITDKPAQPLQSAVKADLNAAVREYTELKMPISMPIFDLGFKETDYKTPLTERLVLSRILMDAIAGDSSELYAALYNEGLLDDSFSADYLAGSFYGASVFSGSSKDPRQVQARLMAEIDRFKRDGIDPERFETLRRKHMGRYIRGFNSIEQICSSQADLFTKKLDLFDLMDSFQNVTVDGAMQRLSRHFTQPALSVVLPLDR
jgi:predicted Zn-dependent peptidase